MNKETGLCAPGYSFGAPQRQEQARSLEARLAPKTRGTTRTCGRCAPPLAALIAVCLLAECGQPTSQHAAKPANTNLIELFRAVDQDDAASVVKLVSTGVNVNARTNSFPDDGIAKNFPDRGVAPLHYAHSKAVAEILVSHGAYLDAQDEAGDTPLEKAAVRGDVQVSGYLIQKGANVNLADKSGATPLIDAYKSNELNTDLTRSSASYLEGASSAMKIVDMLVKHGAHINAHEEDGDFPLFEAAVGMPLSAVKYLLRHHADINQVNVADGRTALHAAVFNEREDVVRFLVKSGADQSLHDNDGKTALELASDLLKDGEPVQGIVRVLENSHGHS